MKNYFCPCIEIHVQLFLFKNKTKQNQWWLYLNQCPLFSVGNQHAMTDNSEQFVIISRIHFGYQSLSNLSHDRGDTSIAESCCLVQYQERLDIKLCQPSIVPWWLSLIMQIPNLVWKRSICPAANHNDYDFVVGLLQ